MSDERTRDERPGTPDGEARDNWIDRLLQRFNPRTRESIRGDLEDALSETVEADDFSPQERAMLKNVLGFHRIRVRDVMVPRADIVAVASDVTLDELLTLFRTVGHSRLPVFGETLDDPVGMVHIRDYLDLLAVRADKRPPAHGADPEPGAGATDLSAVDLGETLASAQILRPVLFVPPSMRAVDLLVRMQAKRTHIALVIDEYGGTEGLVSIEDIVETVVGDIEDEHDDPGERMIVVEEGGTLLVDARAALEDVSAELGTDLSANGEADEIDTLGGLITTMAGRVPARGELIAGPLGLEFEILDADPRRLKRVRVHRRADAGGSAAGTGGEAASGTVSATPAASRESDPQPR